MSLRSKRNQTSSDARLAEPSEALESALVERWEAALHKQWRAAAADSGAFEERLRRLVAVRATAPSADGRAARRARTSWARIFLEIVVHHLSRDGLNPVLEMGLPLAGARPHGSCGRCGDDVLEQAFEDPPLGTIVLRSFCLTCGPLAWRFPGSAPFTFDVPHTVRPGEEIAVSVTLNPRSPSVLTAVELTDKNNGTEVFRTIQRVQRGIHIAAPAPATTTYDLHTVRAVVMNGMVPAVQRRRIAVVPDSTDRNTVPPHVHQDATLRTFSS